VSTPLNAERRRWWCVIGYEISMFRGLRGLRGLSIIPAEHPQHTAWLLANCISETVVLHTRNLCDFCTSSRTDDIKPRDLLDNYATDAKYEKLKGLIECLARQYGTNHEGHVRWVFNKMLAHPTQERGKAFSYAPFLDQIVPALESVIEEIETLRGRPFPAIPENCI